jgi:hypothetical protein
LLLREAVNSRRGPKSASGNRRRPLSVSAGALQNLDRFLITIALTECRHQQRAIREIEVSRMVAGTRWPS